MEQLATGTSDRNAVWGGRGGDAGTAHRGEEARRSYAWLETNGCGSEGAAGRNGRRRDALGDDLRDAAMACCGLCALARAVAAVEAATAARRAS